MYDDLSRTLYSSGACLYRVKPLAIVQAKNKSDVVKVVRYASQQQISLTARGAGTSRVGNELGEGIVLDFSRYMSRVLEINPAEKRGRVEPGIVQGALNKAIKSHKLFFPVDPSTKDHCTIGGMIANNSSGPHAVKYGATRENALSLEAVLASGEDSPPARFPQGSSQARPAESVREFPYPPPLRRASPGRETLHGKELLGLRLVENPDG